MPQCITANPDLDLYSLSDAMALVKPDCNMTCNNVRPFQLDLSIKMHLASFVWPELNCFVNITG